MRSRLSKVRCFNTMNTVYELLRVDRLRVALPSGVNEPSVTSSRTRHLVQLAHVISDITAASVYCGVSGAIPARAAARIRNLLLNDRASLTLSPLLAVRPTEPLTLTKLEPDSV